MSTETFREVAERYRLALKDKAGHYVPAQPSPACDYCGDAKFVRMGDYDFGDPRFGKMQPCPKCNARKQAHPDRLGMLPRDYDLTWGDLVNLPGSNAAAALLQVRKVVERGYGGVYLWGGYGMAKTAILKIATAEWIRKGLYGTYLLFSDLIDEIRAGFDKETSQSAYERLQSWGGMPFLALDELDKARATEFVQETQFRLLDKRYERVTRAEETVTLIASNEAPDTLPPALRSRLSDPRFAVVVELKGRDVRPIADKLPNRRLVHPATHEVLE